MAIPKKYQSLIVLAGIAVCLATVVSVVGVFNKREGEKKKTAEFNSLEPGTNFPKSNVELTPEELGDIGLTNADLEQNPCVSHTFVIIQASVTNLDLVNGAYKLKLDFNPCGAFVDRQKVVVGKSSVLGTPLKISFDNKIYNFAAGVPMASQDFSSNFDTGDINNYPFDKYTVKELYTEGEIGNRTALDTELISIALFFNAGLLTYSVGVDTLKDISREDALSGHIVQLDFSVVRSVTTVFFSGLVMAIMWCLSLLAFTLAVTLWIRGRKVEPPTIAFSIALMFALPGIRNTQPGTPPIGCTADVVSFFWAMSLTAVTASLLIINYIVKYNFDLPPPPAPAVVEKAMEQQQQVQYSPPTISGRSSSRTNFGHNDFA
ncbi:hypothetical protein HDU67_008829 [Dinochytrium kinnereticum]|nr:hypothetical protein HDU67_008829 [Dinochytrium kinnereticum]